MICFNDSYLNSNLRSFDIAVWDNDNGLPGNIIYSEEEVTVEQGEGINGFHTYVLRDPLFIDNIFYIGWKQRSETFLNAGLDINTTNEGRQFFWLNGQWFQSQVDGNLMIRAITGPRIPTTGISDVSKTTGFITIWPNPASETLSVRSDEYPAETLSYSIYDLYGRNIISVSGTTNIDISSLKPGIYILVTTSRGVIIERNKFIKAG
jgi:hypothetical protein